MTDITWTNTRVRLGDLKPWADNPRMSSMAQARRLLKSFETFGQVQTIAIGPDYEVYDGHQRLSALLTLYEGRPEPYLIDARQASRELSDAERRELVVSLHAGAVGSWDWDRVSAWDASELQGWGMDKDLLKAWNNDANNLKELLKSEAPTADAEPQTDRAAELLEKWQCKPGDLWTLGEHRLLIGDCTDPENIKRLFGDEKADCVFTSPPYAVGVDYGETYEDTIDNLRAMLPKLSRLWLDVVTDGGFAVVNFGDIVSASKIVGTDEPCEYPMAFEYFPVFRADGWLLWTRRIWCKPGAGTGSMQCISSNRAATNWEHVWTFKKPGGKPMFTKQTTGDYPSQNGWFDSSHDEGLAIGLKTHGAGMPPLPAMYSISNHSLDGGIVFEPFLGTGTTMVSAQNLSRKCYATEISPSFAALSLERMSAAFPHLDIHRLDA
jgi:DNA modification methylase